MYNIELKLFEFRFGLSILWSLHERLTQDSSIIGAVKIFMLELRLQDMLTGIWLWPEAREIKLLRTLLSPNRGYPLESEGTTTLLVTTLVIMTSQIDNVTYNFTAMLTNYSVRI